MAVLFHRRHRVTALGRASTHCRHRHYHSHTSGSGSTVHRRTIQRVLRVYSSAADLACRRRVLPFQSTPGILFALSLGAVTGETLRVSYSAPITGPPMRRSKPSFSLSETQRPYWTMFRRRLWRCGRHSVATGSSFPTGAKATLNLLASQCGQPNYCAPRHQPGTGKR